MKGVEDMDTIALPQSLLTGQDLSTLGGLVVAVYVIVSFLKDYLKRIGEKILAGWQRRLDCQAFFSFVALIIMLWQLGVKKELSAETLGLAVINSFLVALIAGAAMII
jgi:phosphatidylglycerophosphate synthase